MPSGTSTFVSRSIDTSWSAWLNRGPRRRRHNKEQRDRGEGHNDHSGERDPIFRRHVNFACYSIVLYKFRITNCPALLASSLNFGASAM